MSTATILVVDDQADHLHAVELILDGMGYRVRTCTSGQEALHLLAREPVDLILADIAMPQMNGYQLFEAVRSHTDWTLIPFIFLTARAMDSDIRYGKAMGVDDYLTKPIQPEDLLAAIEGKLRRREHLAAHTPEKAAAGTVPTSQRLRFGTLEIDPDEHYAWHRGETLTLSVREFALLEYLVRHGGHVVHSTDLLQVTHGYGTQDSAEARELLRPLVRSLRRKLGYGSGDVGCIETVRGLGYRLVSEDDEQPTAS